MAKSTADLFPLGIATGAAFCNRNSERELLKTNILSGTHTWLMGYRRYGKTSLVTQVTEELRKKRQPRVCATSVDLLVVHNLKTLDEVLRDAVGRLSADLLPGNRRVLGKLQTIFAAFRPELTLGDNGMTVKLFSPAAPSAQRIEALLHGLDQAAVHFKRRAVLLIDEFQQLSRIDTGHAVEGAIRSVAQRTKALSFVFLGSERSLLAEMFEHDDRPLYHLCSRIEVGRISEEDYRVFLHDAAKMRWSKPLSEPTVTAILALSARHPYYVNALCRSLWRQNRRPGQKTVSDTWSALLQQERHRVSQLMQSLATNQRALLVALARHATDQPTAHTYLAKIGMPSSTVVAALEVLESRDIVRRDETRTYVIVDPLLAGYLRNQGPVN